jgi:hypothetical protein
VTRIGLRILACAIVIALPAVSRAQSPDASAAGARPTGAAAADSWFTRASVSPSRVVAASPFESGGDGAQAVSIEVGRQTGGAAGWHRVYNYPAYGLGVYTARFDHQRELGRPMALYGFFSWPFPVAPRAQLSADVGLGVAWNWKAYDAATNPTNTALGSSAAYHVNGAVLLHYLASERVSLYGGLTATSRHARRTGARTRTNCRRSRQPGNSSPASPAAARTSSRPATARSSTAIGGAVSARSTSRRPCGGTFIVSGASAPAWTSPTTERPRREWTS